MPRVVTRLNGSVWPLAIVPRGQPDDKWERVPTCSSMSLADHLLGRRHPRLSFNPQITFRRSRKPSGASDIAAP